MTHQGGAELLRTMSNIHFCFPEHQITKVEDPRNAISLLRLSLRLYLPASPVLTSDQFVSEIHSHFKRGGDQGSRSWGSDPPGEQASSKWQKSLKTEDCSKTTGNQLNLENGYQGVRNKEQSHILQNITPP